MDLIVIGAGVAGSVLTTMARIHGLEVLLIDQDPYQAGSRCGLAVLRTAWAPETRQALDWYGVNGGVHTPVTLVTDYAGRHTEKSDWHYVDPRDVLVKPDIDRRVTHINPGWAQTADRVVYRAGAVVMAYVPAMDPSSWGCTAYSWDAKVQDYEARHHWLRPFHGITAIQSPDGLVRLGSSLSASPEAAERRTRRMVVEATELGMVSAGTWTYATGKRHEASMPVVTPGLASTGGAARLGFTLAPARAARVLIELGMLTPDLAAR